MGSNWPDGWIPATLKNADLPVTDFTRRALSAWNMSTPTLPYTNNPLGMPNVPGKTSQLLRTGYAMFVTMPAFRQAFAEYLASSSGQAIYDALALDEKYSQVWRAVHSLQWPANTTETDWPSAVLDLTSESYRDSVASVTSPADRKTSGAYGTQNGFGDVSGAVARNAASTTARLQQAGKAITTGIGRLQ